MTHATIKSIRYQHIQSLDDAFLDDIPQTGIITFVGGNNEGKSIFTKIIADTISGNIGNKKARDALISWWSQWGELTLTRHDDVELKIHLARDSALTWVSYDDPSGGEQYKRTLRDGGYIDLIRLFGFHWNDQREVSLNVYETFGPLIMVTTGPAFNHSLIAECTGDPKIEKSIENQKVFIQALDYKRNELLVEANAVNIEAGALKIYDVELQTKVAETYDIRANTLEALCNCVGELVPIKPVITLPRLLMDELEALTSAAKRLPVIEEPSTFDDSDIKLIQTLITCAKKPADITSPKRVPQHPKALQTLTTLASLKFDESVPVLGQQYSDSLEELEIILQERCPTCNRELVS